MNTDALLTVLVEVLGRQGVEALSRKLEELAKGAGEPWQRAALGLIADAVERDGLDGLRLAQSAIEDALDGEVPDIDWASPQAASDLIAELQNTEAGSRSAARDFAVEMGDVLGQVLVGIIRSLAETGASR